MIKRHTSTTDRPCAAVRFATACMATSLLLLLPGQLSANIPWPDEDHSPRRSELLDSGWRSIASEDAHAPFSDAHAVDFDDSAWEPVNVPHNWDRYQGFRQSKHGVFHGAAIYRRTFQLQAQDKGRQIFLMFEGVGSYASVWVNGQLVGQHAGGLVSFTVDITAAIDYAGANQLTVRAEHPAGIRDLPWVCGGCELSYGFSEGTQPFGIFRPVHLIITDSLRIEPFGVHIWNDESINHQSATVRTRSTVRNYGGSVRVFTLLSRLLDADGNVIAQLNSPSRLRPGGSTVIAHDFSAIDNPRLWSPADPYLYTMETQILSDSRTIDRIPLPFGIRSVQWPDLNDPTPQPLLINGEPFFINGVADYEHLMGNSHAFSDAEVLTRIRKIRAAGFNAFRDAHHPHNLRFQRYLDREGMLWWTQNGAQIWFDNDDFRANYKTLVRAWIRERRNSPSLILYGLQNESKLPVHFTEENVAIIRGMDPTASIQRLIASCNGGEGTDWDIPQNWTGTYGGDPTLYAEDLLRQRLVGEYGAWRNLELHDENGFVQDGPHTEGRMTALMEMKVRLAETVRDSVIGHFMWPFTTHQNPGRNVGYRGTQTRDGIRELDQIGPANNKGLQTIWGEPLDVFYMYRANYAPSATQPMVYIASHTWPDRWTRPGIQDSILVYSNCDEVELFDDYHGRSLGVRQRGPKGTHFRWDGVEIRTMLLHAIGRVNGKAVASDRIQLHHLPRGDGWERMKRGSGDITRAIPGHRYLVRVNAGGPEYTDIHGNVWAADSVSHDGDAWGSRSWADNYPYLHPVFGSKRKIFDPIDNTRDDLLFQSFRYGRDELKYRFHLDDGDYTVELFFIEPWYGTGGGMDCSGWRQFDVAINGRTLLENLDIWSEAGRATALRKSVTARVSGGLLELSFPRIQSTQAVISAIAISSAQLNPAPLAAPARLIQNLQVNDTANADAYAALTWLDTGVRFHGDHPATLSELAWEVREAEWIRTARASAAFTGTELLRFTLRDDADVYIAYCGDANRRPQWLQAWHPTELSLATSDRPDQPMLLLRRAFHAGDTIVLGPNGSDAADRPMYGVIVALRLPPAHAVQIHHLQVHNSSASSAWQAIGNFRAGREQYTDAGMVITRFPSMLSDADWIRTAQGDAANPELTAQFTIADHLELFVALDSRITDLPDWLADWLATPHLIESAPGEHLQFRLYRARAAPGDVVHLGPNGRLADGTPAHMYSLLTRTIRAAQYYPPEQRIHVADDTVDWVISVDAGDRYNLNFRYTLLDSTPPIEAAYSIISLDGRTVCSGTLRFDPADPPGSPLVSRNRTCNSINAGTYHIRIVSAQLHRIVFDTLEVE